MRVSVLHLENQNWGGTLEPVLGNLTFLRKLKLSNIKLHGEIPREVGRLKRLKVLDLSNNNFHGKIPIELTNCTNLKEIILLYNQLTGNIPSWFGSMMQLNKLLLGANNLVGTIPPSLGNISSLQNLTLARNHLKGSIPHALGNSLNGSIPSNLGSLSKLQRKYSIKYCTQLQTLAVSTNKLSGDIPDQVFGNLENLIFLDLSNNSLTGPLPSVFGNLKHLSIFYLYANKLSGEIPKELGACFTLTELVLERNFFIGSIPSSLGSLRSLEILDISNNNFSSTIPFELENLTLLNTLDLSFNNLYGEVPNIGGVFSNISAITLTGNKNLCGGITQLKLPICFKVPSKKHKRSLKKKLIFASVIGGVLISFIAFIIVHFLTRKSKRLQTSPSLQNRFLRVTYGELHEATNGFSSSNLVGAGSFGSVYKGSLLHFERPIVVKVLNLETRGAEKSFMAECKALGKMKHRNLLKILTCCSSVDYDGEDFKAIVFEFMPNGSLEKLLHDIEGSDNHNLNFTQRIDIALDVAHALNYLHNDTEQVVVHCDVKPSNVLLDDDLVAHLGDFGLARLIHGATGHSNKDQISSSTIKGTIGYLPPAY
ncbi:LRR receptor-like kinase resistance protein [Trifolium pratense]|uniref:non-specific serine/threonine protein kinase n=1 Tax=Trifolium pratense TaxID=57577 RepID=A0A2K3L911_TRIPR|nr:LRR receptor-like kinase resistance protein [Trifolium pratense]